MEGGLIFGRAWRKYESCHLLQLQDRTTVNVFLSDISPRRSFRVAGMRTSSPLSVAVILTSFWLSIPVAADMKVITRRQNFRSGGIKYGKVQIARGYDRDRAKWTDELLFKTPITLNDQPRTFLVRNDKQMAKVSLPTGLQDGRYKADRQCSINGPGMEGDDKDPMVFAYWTEVLDKVRRGNLVMDCCGCFGGYLVRCWLWGTQNNLFCPADKVNNYEGCATRESKMKKP